MILECSFPLMCVYITHGCSWYQILSVNSFFLEANDLALLNSHYLCAELCQLRMCCGQDILMEHRLSLQRCTVYFQHWEFYDFLRECEEKREAMHKE